MEARPTTKNEYENILVYLKSGSGSKMIIRRKMNTYSFLTVGVPTTTTTTTITTTAVFPRGSKKRKSSMEDEALTGRS